MIAVELTAAYPIVRRAVTQTVRLSEQAFGVAENPYSGKLAQLIKRVFTLVDLRLVNIRLHVVA